MVNQQSPQNLGLNQHCTLHQRCTGIQREPCFSVHAEGFPEFGIRLEGEVGKRKGGGGGRFRASLPEGGGADYTAHGAPPHSPTPTASTLTL